MTPANTAKQAAFDVWVQTILTVLEFDRDPNWCVSPSAYEPTGYLLTYCYTGHAAYTLHGETFDMKSGDLLFLRRNESRAGHADPNDPCGLIVVCFELECLQPEDQQFLQAMLGKRHLNWDAYPLFKEMSLAWMSRRTGYLFRIRNLISRIVLELLSQHQSALISSEKFSVIDQAVSLLERNLQRTFSPAELAEKCHFSEGYFRQQFKKYTGMSVMNYQNFLRVNRAKEYLVYGNYNVSQTAQILGFGNPYYFCRVFKKWTGQSPTEYKKSFKE